MWGSFSSILSSDSIIPKWHIWGLAYFAALVLLSCFWVKIPESHKLMQEEFSLQFVEVSVDSCFKARQQRRREKILWHMAYKKQLPVHFSFVVYSIQVINLLVVATCTQVGLSISVSPLCTATSEPSYHTVSQYQTPLIQPSSKKPT